MLRTQPNALGTNNGYIGTSNPYMHQKAVLTVPTTANGALIYNSSTTAGTANRAVLVLDFGSDKTSSSGDFTITFPTADSSSAIIRIA